MTKQVDLSKIIALLKTYEEVDFALLFGSYASLTASTLSDIDIGIFFKSEPDLLSMGSLVTQLESVVDKKVDLAILNHLPSTRPLLAYNITRNHTPLIVNNNEKYAKFKIDSLHYYLDFKPVLDAQDEALQERITNGTYGKIQTA